MKSLQFIFINALTAIIGLSLMSGSFSNNDAHAAASDLVPKIELQKLGNYKGQFLTAYYAVGSRPFIATDSSQVKLTEIRSVNTQAIDSDVVVLPALELQKQGFRGGYNLLVLVISPVPGFSWLNADGSQTAGASVSENHRATLIRSFSKAEIESLAVGQGAPESVVLTLD